MIERIRRVSRAMSLLCLVGMVGLPISLALAWATPELLGGAYPALESQWGPPGELPIFSRVLGFLVSMIPTALVIYGLSRLRRLFRLYEAGEIFSADAARCLKQFAIAVMLQAVLRPLSGAVLSVVVTFHNPPGQRMLTVGLGGGEYAALLLGGLMLVIAWIMGEGARIADENRQFV
ncbi:MAG: DUF2975 domain-containing protein [Pseudomonadota bacterium]